MLHQSLFKLTPISSHAGMQRMPVPQLTRKLAKLQVADRPAANQILTSPCIAAIYGFASREHMQRHLLKF